MKSTLCTSPRTIRAFVSFTVIFVYLSTPKSNAYPLNIKDICGKGGLIIFLEYITRGAHLHLRIVCKGPSFHASKARDNGPVPLKICLLCTHETCFKPIISFNNRFHLPSLEATFPDLATSSIYPINNTHSRSPQS